MSVRATEDRTVMNGPARDGSDGAPREPRYEIKTVCEQMGLEQVLAELRLRGAAFRTLHPRRTVQSVYLDTPFDRALEENLSGVSRREKIRFRWYGPDTREVVGVLERKVRENRLGWKDSLRLSEPVRVEGSPRRAFLRALERCATEQWREWMAGLEPAQWIAYERDYFTTADGAIRMTIDRNLRFYDQRWRATLSRACPAPRPQIMVVECKAPASQEERLHDLLGDFPLVVDKCSKFAMASGEGGPIISMLPV